MSEALGKSEEELRAAEIFAAEPRYVSNNELFSQLQSAKETSNDQQVAEIREEIIEANRSLADWIASKFSPTQELEMGDIESRAFEGLIIAVDNFNPSLGYEFSTYAYPCVEGQILRGIAESHGSTGLDVNEFWRMRKVTSNENEYTRFVMELYPRRRNAIITKLQQRRKWNYQPEETEIADEFAREMSQRIKMFRQVTEKPVSLDQKREVYSWEKQGTVEVDIEPLAGREADPIEGIHQIVLADQLDRVLSTLSEKERIVLALRFGLDDIVREYAERQGNEEFLAHLSRVDDEIQARGRVKAQIDPGDYTLDEIGQMFGVVGNRIGQIEAKAIKKLRHPSRNKRLRDYLEN